MDDIMKMVLAQATGNEQADPQETASQETTGQSGDPGQPGDQVDPGARQSSPWGFWIPLMLMMLVMYYFLFLKPKRRQQEQTQKMKEGLKRNARIQTIGGIIGTVVDVRDDEVVIKIDETNNTKMRLARRAVGQVLADDETAPKK